SVMAEFWLAINYESMAQRLMASYEYLFGDRTAPLPSAAPVIETPDPPTFEIQDATPRILFLINERPHFGLDILFDGLCTILGDDHVVDYPRKPWLHGEQPPNFANYPCT